MLGRRKHEPDGSGRLTRLPTRGDRRLDDRVIDLPRTDGPVAFAPTKVGGSGRRGAATAAILGVALVGLIGAGIAGRPSGTRPGIAATTPVTDASAVAAGPAGTVRPRPQATILVLTSPSHDDAVMLGRLTVVGFVRGEGRDVSLRLGDGERVMGSWRLPSAAKAGDPAYSPRAWFETTFGIGMFPTGRPLWLEVDVIRDDGGVDRIRRSFRVGPIVEPDEE